MTTQDLSFATATELSRLLRRKQVSSVELAKLFLDRLAAQGPKYNALAELTPELALSQARKADRLLKSGDAPSLLTGVPFGAKDLLATKGIPTRWGIPGCADQVFDYDATAIVKMREAGAVLIGKLAMVEVAGGGGYEYANASLNGPGLNPWNVNHWAGGSSSGSGSSVSAGLVPFALGSETWGSITTPAAYCGITGLRPTWGLVSRYGAMELAWRMDKIGPLARSAEDCGYILQAIAGRDPLDATTERDGFTFKPRAAKRSYRLAVLPADFSDEPELEQAYNDALKVLRKAGMKLVRTDLPDFPINEIARFLIDVEMAAAHEEMIRSSVLDTLVDKAQQAGLRRNLTKPATEYVRAQQQQLAATQAILRMFDEYDAFVSPTLVIESPSLDTNLQTAFRKRGGYSVLGALCGVPQITVPMGFGGRGLPVGLSFTTNRFDEQTALNLAMLFQRETDWHTKHPPQAA
jgi:aspartyl-tRNA(Asn)/glutamyl-tRNA(Gln) amidotransferase subunit A